jgi:Spirocyclase AveC-like
MFAWTVIAIAAAVLIACNLHRGVTSDRIRNPDVSGAPRPVSYMLGISDSTWVAISQVGTLIVLIVTVVWCVVAWRRNPGSAVVLMVLATTALAWLDPIMNWATFAAYNPHFVHLPEDWPLVSLSPTVEPMICVGYSYFMVAYFPAIAIVRGIQSRRTPEALIHRHPLVCLAAVTTFVIGFVFDVAVEVMLVSQGQYVFSQVVPFGSMRTRTPYQFPLIWQATLVLMVMVPAAVLLYRDDTGRTVAAKLAQRAANSSEPAAARHVPSDVVHPHCRLPRLWDHLPGHASGRLCHRVRVSVGVPRGQGVRPAGSV